MRRNELWLPLLCAIGLAWPGLVGAQAAAKVTLGDMLKGQRAPVVALPHGASAQAGLNQPGALRAEAQTGPVSEVLGIYGTEPNRRVVLRHQDTTYPGLLPGQVTPLGRLAEIDGLCAEFVRPGHKGAGQRLCLNTEAFYAHSSKDEAGAAPIYTEYSLPTPPAGSAPLAVPNVLSVVPAISGGPGVSGLGVSSPAVNNPGASSSEATAIPATAAAPGALPPHTASGKP